MTNLSGQGLPESSFYLDLFRLPYMRDIKMLKERTQVSIAEFLNLQSFYDENNSKT